MNETYLQPVVLITTLQPLLVGWVLAISFFLTLAVVAMVSRGRKWCELGFLFIILFALLAVIGLGVTTLFTEVQVVDLEVITLAPRR